MSQLALHVTPKAVPYCPLSVASAFKDLSKRQKLYAHHLLSAGWAGAPVVSQQLSGESLPLLRLFYALFSAQPLDAFKAAAASTSDVTSDDVRAFLDYFSLLYANMGNYLSFGDSKFIPACSKDTFARIVANAGGATLLDSHLLDAAYDLAPSKLTLDFPPKGLTAYYSSNITREDATLANEFLASKKMDGVNTRVWKSDADGSLRVLVASAHERKLPAETFKGRSIAIEYGDFKAEMQRVVAELTKARQFAESATQERMLDHYIKHFQDGDVEEHRKSQIEWVKDIGPAVESNIGFIESYRDPSGVRAEWEGFVAVVNADQSKKYGELVAKAEQFIPLLPWGRSFEKDAFSSPDFTSLEVLGFASSGIPSGICIPNYDDIRQDHGFKNVYLANVVSAINFTEKANHLTDADWEVYRKGFVSAMSVNVGIHELLGHGTGKLFIEKDDGSKNFADGVTNPLTGQPVATWYKPGETFGSVFGGIGSSYEECRAEAVALYLSVQSDLLAIFDLQTAEAQADTIHVCWLNMVRAGLVGLEMYTPETRQWRQAHMRARYCILQVLLRGPNPLVTIAKDAKEGLLITLDRSRIKTDGVKAIGELLLNLSVCKSVADAKRGTDYYAELTSVNDEFVQYREIVMAKRKPRREYVQAHTTLQADGDVVLHEFAGSVEGMIESFVARHKDIPL